MYKSIPEDLMNDFGTLVNEIIDDMIKDSTLPSKDIITLLANHYNIERTELVECLKKVDSPYTANNNIVFYDGHKYVKRTAHSAQIHRVFVNIKNGMDDALDHDNIESFTDIIFDKYSIKVV
jgi:hypothetical protein